MQSRRESVRSAARLKIACAVLVALGSVALAAAGASPAPAKPAKPPKHFPEPTLGVPLELLESGLNCHGEVEHATSEPLLFVTGTGATGDESYLIGKGAFDALGH